MFVLDFQLIGDNIYVDFNSLEDLNNTSDSLLIINLVTKQQFATFRLINLPAATKHVSVRVLVSGDASVNYWEKRTPEAHSAVEVANAPLYARHENRTDWIAYLEKTLSPKQQQPSPIRNYVEYLTMLCHVSHVRLDFATMIRLASGRETFSNQRLGKRLFIAILNSVNNLI